ncbi:MAG: toprim domain-containing protein, partial [Opitutaceae bacterium]
MRETGHEHFRGRVVFPVVAENGVIGTIYGRAINKVEKPDRHSFLAGPLRGVWNPAALRSAEVIITEGIIDALTFYCAGFRHVTTSYSAKALPDELLDALVAARVQRAAIAFDRDASGDTGAVTAAAQLAARGIECLRVMFPPGYDANRYALAVTPPEKSLGVLLRSALPIGELRSKPAVSSSPDARAPVSSLAALAAEAAPAVAAPEAKPEASTPAEPPPEAAKGKTVVAPAQPSTSANDVPATAAPVTHPSPVAVVKNAPEEIVLVLGEREWRVRGLGKNAGFESLKVTLRVAHGERWHLDNFDLCLAQKRAAFVTAAAVETNLKPDLLKRDLGHVLQKLEELQEARLKAEAAPKTAAAPVLSELLRAAALSLLRDPRLLERILRDFARCGVVGEETNKLVGYLAAVSRLMEHPLAVIIQSSSAAGKTTLMDMILSFMPLEVRLKYSAMTGQSLFYMGGVDLRHKILAIVEEEGAEKASYALKLLQSEQELRIASTGKNPQTGRMETQEYHVQGPTMIFLTTTSHTLDEELQNRCLVLTVDESREQTERIHALQREARTEAGLARKAERAALRELHRAAQSLLVPLPVFNPYAEKLRFLSHQLRTRRDHEKYQLLIDSLAVLFQYQRERKTIAGREHVVATLDDIARANELAHEVLGRGLDELPPQTRRLLEQIERMVAEKCAAAKLERCDARFRARTLREFTGWGHSQLHVHLARLVELEYLIPHRADHGQGVVYELLYDGGGKNGARFLPGLIDVEKLRMDATTAPECPGVNGERPAPIRPHSGPVPGAVRPDENTESSPENRAPDAKSPENTQPDGDANSAAA